ncbi:4Fe-4S dicluster domain-containing protein [Marinisporobacter balticus]|uniref:4Fe-4S dicluster protein n=1 Tax=Marinisporobacter balticus TaxID=2018667 RepID=A0A4R2KHP5_9FIRM|nr:4Fe-4S dicluster domain-containing protein [Marinisporobacter balticus]TCO70019.1 4Fe-4S dicluster protein [Marinisporobacter balticus]
MEKIGLKVRARAKEALENREVDEVMGWKKGEFWYDVYPVFITEANEADDLIWDAFCVNNLSKYLIQKQKENKKVGVFLKGCDSLGFNQLLKDNRIDRDQVVIYGLPCVGMVDPEKVKKEGLNKGLLEIKRSKDEITFVTKEGEKKILGRQFDYDKCLACRYPNPVVYDELLDTEIAREVSEMDRFKDVEAIEKMSITERFEYWSNQFSKCIRCNACRNICPACSCEKCVFDNVNAGVSSKASVDSEEQFFHITRAYHVAGRCVDCGECTRVCPAGIPLDQLNHKIMKDINELYGKYDAGVDVSQDAPLVTYKLDDADSFTEHGKGGK